MPDPTPTPTSVPAATVGVVFTDTVLRRFLFGVVIAMTAVVSGVAAAAFYTSFEAIRSFAARSGGIDPRHAWLAPLLVDSFIFVASAADLWCSATGAARTTDGRWQRAVLWLPKALLALAAGGSFALNVAHAPTHIGARVVAALAPAGRSPRPPRSRLVRGRRSPRRLRPAVVSAQRARRRCARRAGGDAAPQRRMAAWSRSGGYTWTG